MLEGVVAPSAQARGVIQGVCGPCVPSVDGVCVVEGAQGAYVFCHRVPTVAREGCAAMR